MRFTLITLAGLMLATTACGGSTSDGGAGGTQPGAADSAGQAAAPAGDSAGQATAPAGDSAGQAAAPAGDSAGQAAAPAIAPGALPGEVATGAERTLDSGLKIITIQEGTGAQAQSGQMVSVHYTGYLTNGTKFDSSVDRGQPFSFQLGTGAVIKGWDEGIAQLKVGGKAKLIVPPALGYDAAGFGSVIPPDSTLVFDVELVSAQ